MAKVRERTAKVAMYWCEGCEEWYEQEGPVPTRVLAWNYEEGAREQDLEFNEVAMCHDEGDMPCTITDDPITVAVGDTIYECGSCNEIFADETEAVECCQ